MSGETTASPAGPKLSAVICTHDRYDLLPEAIESLLRQDIELGAIEIIVVDNSSDQSAATDFARRYAGTADLRYLVEPQPGLSNARNVGVAAARGGIVAFIDDDGRAAPGWARALIAAHSVYQGEAGIVGGRVIPRWQTPPPGWLGSELFGYLSLVDLGDERRELKPGEFLVGCNLSFDRAALLATGGFSIRLGRIGSGATLLSNEELEVANRVARAGKLAIYAPDAVVEHVVHGNRLTQDWMRRRAAWQAVSDLLSRPDEAEALARDAAAHLHFERPRIGRFPERDTSEAVRHDMVTTYSEMILALHGGKVDAAHASSGWLQRIFRR
ncbi:MAG TPA: glycosyltransferase [Stellaceae bacterium]|nr:glycosyltransferase [Stellaceae bacterium]